MLLRLFFIFFAIFSTYVTAQSNSCLNDGTLNSNGTCQCLPGFNGQNCEVNINLTNDGFGLNFNFKGNINKTKLFYYLILKFLFFLLI